MGLFRHLKRNKFSYNNRRELTIETELVWKPEIKNVAHNGAPLFDLSIFWWTKMFPNSTNPTETNSHSVRRYKT